MPLFYHKYVNYVLAHSVNYVITLYSLPLPLHRTSPSPQPPQSTSIVSPRTITLASLVKGEVLSPERIRATTGGIATPPSLACTNPPKPTLSLSLFVGEGLAPPVAPNLSIPTTFSKVHPSPCPAPPNLPPLSKVRCCRPKEFGRLPEGLPHHHLSLAPTLPNPHYHTLSTTCLAPLPKGAGLRQGYFLL